MLDFKSFQLRYLDNLFIQVSCCMQNERLPWCELRGYTRTQLVSGLMDTLLFIHKICLQVIHLLGYSFVSFHQVVIHDLSVLIFHFSLGVDIVDVILSHIRVIVKHFLELLKDIYCIIVVSFIQLTGRKRLNVFQPFILWQNFLLFVDFSNKWLPS